MLSNINQIVNCKGHFSNYESNGIVNRKDPVNFSKIYIKAYLCNNKLKISCKNKILGSNQ